MDAFVVAGSTDMLNLIRLYQESDDRDTVERWMDIFAQNKLNQSVHNSTQHSYENAYLRKFFLNKKNIISRYTLYFSML